MIRDEFINSYTSAIKNGGFLFAAQIGDIQGSIPAGDGMYRQTVQTLNNIRDILNTENADLSDIVKCNIYVTDMNEYREFCRAYNSVMPQPYPMSKCVEVSRLRGDAKVEIDIMAYIGKQCI